MSATSQSFHQAALSLESPGRLLAPWGTDVTSLDIDLFLRYTATARLLDRMLTNIAAPVRILEVGCHGHDVLTRLFDRDLVQVKRCDIEQTTDAPDFFVIPPQPPWPIESESYDAVVALEVLEHLPAARRQPFIAECLRIARHGAVFTTPNAAPQVVEAERLADEAFQRRHGKAHPFLEEHHEHGLVSPDEIARILQELNCPHVALDSEPIDVWLPMLLLAENLKEKETPGLVQRRLNEIHFSGSLRGSGAPYRKVYACAKSAEARAGLPAEPRRVGSAEESWPGASILQNLAGAAGEVLAGLGKERIEQEQLQAAHRAEVAALLEVHRADLAVVQEDLAEANRQLLEYRQRFLVLSSYLQSLFGSAMWRLLEPVRLLRQLLRPRGFDANALVAWQHLERDLEATPGTWLSTGKDPQFVVPCVLPAGPLRVRIRMTSEVHSFLELYTDNGTGSASNERLAWLPVEGMVDREFLVELPKPALALRFDPIDGPGRFRIDRLEVAPVPRLFARAIPVLKDESDQLVTDETDANTFAPAPPNGAGGRLNIVYVLRTMGLCGGVKVVLEHVSRLHARGHNVRIYYLDGGAAWFPRPVPAFSFSSPEALQRALAEFRGVKVATWYETAPWVAESLRPGDRGYYLVQDIEESYCNTPADAAAVLQTYTLGLKPITEGTWVRDQLKQRFGLDPIFVSIGLDHDLFQPRPATRDPHAILTQARTWSGGGEAGKRLKGWDTARRTILRCRELNPQTALLTFSMEDRHEFPKEMPHVHVKKPSDAELAKLYSRAGVYLLASNHEGFGLTAAEAMACGCPVVATRAHGNEEFCIDGQTALVAQAGDFEALARHCATLQTDPRLAAELGGNGRRFILDYTWDRVIDRLEQEFVTGAAPETIPAQPIQVEIPVDASGGEYPDLDLEETATADWSIVIPTINNVDLVSQCVTSCRRWLPRETTVQFIVVDDGTRDPALLAGLREAAREVGFELLFNQQNLGFSATVNHGMRQARGRFIALCNNDILFSQPWLKPLEKVFAEQPRVGIAGIRLLYPDGSIQHAGMDKVPSEMSWVHSFCRRPGDDPEAVRSRDVWSVSGAFFAMRREVLRRLGGFSTAYSTAYEDLDYCLRAWNLGVRVHYCGQSVAYHLEGGTRGATPQEKRVRPLLWRQREEAGRLYFEKKWSHLRRIEHFEQVAWQPAGCKEDANRRPATTASRSTASLA